MSYGLSVRNDESYLQIDSEQPRLCAIYNGAYQALNESTARVTFSKPITTQEPPCIFIQNSQDQPDVIYTGMMLVGGPYSWTGFTVATVNVQNRPKGKWFAAVFASETNASYGMRLWDGSGKTIYDTASIPVIVTKANQYWTYPQRTQIGATAFAYRYDNTMVAQIVSDEYFMINPFSRGALTANVMYTVPTGVKYDWVSSRLQMFIVTNTQGIIWNEIGNYAAVFARLPGA